MMKTPHQIIGQVLGTPLCYRLTDQITEALDAAGYVIVPKEPTDEMIATASQLYGTVRAMLRAVLAAKP